MKNYLFALLINIKVLRFVRSCNEFGDFCDTGDEEFIELDSDFTSLTTIMDRRMKIRGRRSLAPVYSKKEAGRKVTETLDSLFEESGYDKRFRPGLGGSATEITVNIFIRSMGPIDEGLQKFTFDCYFRQWWTDGRLAYNNSNSDFKVKCSRS